MVIYLKKYLFNNRHKQSR